MIEPVAANVVPAPSGLLWLALVCLFAGCSSFSRPQVEPPPVVIEAPVRPSNFTIAAGMLDTWNAVGQILVRLNGVTYEGRAQKLGLYDVEYRGERFLILTRALVLTRENQATTTEVRAALQDGKADTSAPATELLGLLQTQLPGELVRVASEQKSAPVKKSKSRKRSIRH